MNVLPAGTATVRQRKFLVQLAVERDVASLSDEIQSWAAAAVAGKELEKDQASRAISALLKLPVAKSDAKTTPGKDTVPAGRYALPGADGTTKFVHVTHGTGKWEGYTFCMGLSGAPGNFTEHRLNRAQQASILQNIAKDVQAALALYGRKFQQCGHCSSPLTDLQSRAAGYGEKCAANHKYFYPTKKQAQFILQEGSAVASNG